MIKKGRPFFLVKALPLIFTFCILLSCSDSSNKIDVKFIHPKTISVEGNRFEDNFGRQVILNGINVVSKNKKENYLFEGGPSFYSNLKKWGFNSIRFIIIWDGLEPQPGVYNEEYLKEIDKRIKWAGDNGIFVVLDMHQDLFSVKYADGAPAWATLDEGKKHIEGEIWSDAYMLSPAVQTAFNNFWANKKVSDGIGVQDHFIALWKHVAKRYAGNSTVIGYDLMNEPFPGSSATQALPTILQAYGKLMYQLNGTILSEKDLLNTWTNAENKAKMLQTISTKENFAQVMDALYPLCKAFETEQVQPMFQKVSDAIRQVDTSHVLFLEHAYYGNIGVRSSIQRTTLPDGRPDPKVAYAPHGYDLVTDTKNAAEASAERVSFIYNRLQEKGKELNMPVWLGEWGAFYKHDEKIVPVAKQAVGEIEKNLFGNAYWSYDPDMEKQAYFQKAIIRPYPSYINGELLSYHFNDQKSELNIQWAEDKDIVAPTIAFVPWLSRLNNDRMDKKLKIKITTIPDSDAGWVAIEPLGKSEKREVAFFFKK